MVRSVAVLILLASLPAAAADARLEVSVDWSAVSDELIDRCELSGLENLLLQSIVDEGYAVANEVGNRGIEVEMLEKGRLILVSAHAVGNEEADTLPVPKRCDSTIQVELVRIVLELIAAVAPHLEERPISVVAPPEQPPLLPDLPADLGLEVALGGVVPGSTSLLPWLRATLWGRAHKRFFWGVALESAFTANSDPFVAEPALAAQARYRVLDNDLRIDVGVEIALVGHVFARDDLDTDGHVDARFAIAIALALPEWSLGAVILPTARLCTVEHRRAGGDTVFRSSRWGVIVGLFWTHDLGNI
jgi:hypothetical protein